MGTKKIFEYKAFDVCDSCIGSGVEKGYKMVNCDVCQGAGQVRQTTKTAFGVFARILTCSKCGGKRKMPEKECSICSGSGRVKTLWRPAGVCLIAVVAYCPGACA